MKYTKEQLRTLNRIYLRTLAERVAEFLQELESIGLDDTLRYEATKKYQYDILEALDD
jgi:hypothetical protein